MLKDIGAILSHLKTEPQGPRRVIFDLDSTLFCVSFRTQQILRDYGRERGPRAPKLAGLAEITTTPRDWGIREALRRAGLDLSPEEFRDIRDYWGHRFFSSEYLHLDEPYEGAVEFVNAVAATGARLQYLTARDSERMLSGTIHSLRKWGFPLDRPGIELSLKPDRALSDAEFKSAVAQSLCGEPGEKWFFENEPVIIHEVRRVCPAIQLIFMDSVHSGRAASPTDLPTLPMTFFL